jgi:hypothetical protein
VLALPPRLDAQVERPYVPVGTHQRTGLYSLPIPAGGF